MYYFLIGYFSMRILWQKSIYMQGKRIKIQYSKIWLNKYNGILIYTQAQCIIMKTKKRGVNLHENKSFY